MRKPKKYYYVQVIDGTKPKFVTRVDNIKHYSYWDGDKKPLSLGYKSIANDIAYGLCVNGFYAFIVESLYELTFTNDDLNK